MLLRVYRLTDKLSLIFLKTSAGFWTLVTDGLLTILGTPSGDRRGVIGILARIVAVIVRIIRMIAGVIGVIVAGVIGLVARLMGGTTAAAANATMRASGQAGAVPQRAMARRAKRAEIDATIKEDPLLIQNRMLSGLVVIALIGLIAVVLWATRPQSTPFSLGVSDINQGGSGLLGGQTGTPTQASDTGAPLAPPTSIPTATQIPEVLQARGSVAFTLRENGQNDLWAFNITTRNPLRVTNDVADERDPALSPDGARLAYASNRDGNWEIYIYDLRQFGDPSQPQRMTFNLAFEGSPVWSPDGRYLAYETYQNGNLDIYVLPVSNTEQPLEPLTTDNTAEFSPAWSPQGREIAFVSWRNSAQDIFVFSLDTLTSTNITNTPERHEDYPVIHPNGDLIAYSAVDQGIEKVFVKSIRDLEAPAQPIGIGREPAWSPDGNSLIAAVDSIDATHLTVYPYDNLTALQQIFAVRLGATSPTWVGEVLPGAVTNGQGLPLRAEPLYTEQVQTVTDERYQLRTLINGVEASPNPLLSERVDDSFNALRERVLTASGRDFLASLEATFWTQDILPQAGEEQRNWHYTGRAFSVNRSAALFGLPQALEIVREERGLETTWRLYLRVDDEAAGQLGEPLRRLPWDMNARASGDTEAYNNGGKLKAEMPSGYYVDLTQLAADYGWRPMPAGSTWRANVNAANYWTFFKPEGMPWMDAMLEIYFETQLGAFAPTATPQAVQPLPTPPGGDTTGDSG